jgi:hypothetical protein
MDLVVGCSEELLVPDFSSFDRFNYVRGPLVKAAHWQSCLVGDVLDHFVPGSDKSMEDVLLFWFAMAQNVISRCRVSFSYVDLVCLISSKLARFGSLIRGYRDKWLIEFSWGNWHLFDILCALVTDIVMFGKFLIDCYRVSDDVLFFIQNSSFVFGYLEGVISNDLEMFLNYFSFKDKIG